MDDVLDHPSVGDVSQDPEELKSFLNALASGTIGIEAPRIERIVLTSRDSWLDHQRLQTSKKFNIPLQDVAEEPDEGAESWLDAHA